MERVVISLRDAIANSLDHKHIDGREMRARNPREVEPLRRHLAQNILMRVEKYRAESDELSLPEMDEEVAVVAYETLRKFKSDLKTEEIDTLVVSDGGQELKDFSEKVIQIALEEYRKQIAELVTIFRNELTKGRFRGGEHFGTLVGNILPPRSNDVHNDHAVKEFRINIEVLAHKGDSARIPGFEDETMENVHGTLVFEALTDAWNNPGEFDPDNPNAAVSEGTLKAMHAQYDIDKETEN